MRVRNLFAALVAASAIAAALPVAPAAAAGEPVITNQAVESFDGTMIWSHLFLPAEASAANPAPLIMRTHGWGGTGEASVGTGTLAKLLDAGYAVMTWDSRGFGESGGEVMVDKPEFEGQDASALITWAVDNVPEIALEAPDDPIVGFTGGSYAGGIQMATAAFDPRVDALVPEIPWSDLRYSLYENRVINFGWGQLLYGVGLATATGLGITPPSPNGIQTGSYDQALHQAQVEGEATNEFSEDTVDFFGASSLAVYGEENPVTIPTLVIQGSVDTLFDLSDGYAVYEHVKAQGAPAKFIAFCGGHVGCPGYYEIDSAAQREYLDEQLLTWFAKHLRGEDVDTGAPIEYITNEAEWRTADDFPLATDAEQTLAVDTEGSILGPGSVPTGGANPTTATPSRPGDPAAFTTEVAVAEGGALELLGRPTVHLEVTGMGPTTHLFVKLVDREAGAVVNLQETPLRVDGLSGEAQEFDLVMSGVAYTLQEGHHLDLQVSATSLMHANARTPSEVDVVARVEVPYFSIEGGGQPGVPSELPTERPNEPQGHPSDPVSPSPSPSATPSVEATGDETADGAPLATTGPLLPVLVPLGALAAAAALRRRR